MDEIAPGTADDHRDGTVGDDVDLRLRRGSEGYRKLSIAMFAAGLATFALLYTTQPLLPLLSRELHVSSATSSLTLAATSLGITVALLPAGWLSDVWGRTRVMKLSLIGSAVLVILAAASPNFVTLVGLRFLQGIALAGLPAVAMAYLVEEVHPESLGSSIGLYIGGNAIGGMAGRLVGGAFADFGGWRVSLLGVGLISLACTAVFLQRSRRGRGTSPRTRSRWARRSRACAPTCATPASCASTRWPRSLMGTFVAVFNGLSFRLEEAPYGLGETAIAAVFLVYPLGSLSSAVAGRLADRIGRRAVLPVGVLIAGAGLAMTLLQPLPLIILGIAVLTIGFFAAHSVASSWVGRRAAHATRPGLGALPAGVLPGRLDRRPARRPCVGRRRLERGRPRRRRPARASRSSSRCGCAAPRRSGRRGSRSAPVVV